MAKDSELAGEIEAATKRLEEETRRKDKEADERLDELLSRKRMEFCPRCGGKVRSRSGWAGKCLHNGCDQLVCSECWADEGKRYCRKHEGDFVVEERPDEGDLKNLTLNYMDFVWDRVGKFGLDWNHEGFIRKAKASRRKKKYGEFEVVVYEKRLLSKKPKIRILVRPLTEAFEGDVNGALERLESEAGVYEILVFVGSPSSSQKAVRFASGFSNKRISLFVMDAGNGSIHFNAGEKISGKYSLWFDPAGMPVRFADLLKNASESVSGRKVVSAASFAEEMGVGKEEASRILRESGKLEEAKGADSFIIKESS
jgi:hypothetical protein